MSIALLTGSYYLVILLLYYRNDFKYWLASRHGERIPSAPAFETNGKELHQPQLLSEEIIQGNVGGDKQEAIPIVQSLKDEVHAFFDEAHKGITKKDLLVFLNGITNKYPTVLESPYQQSINQLIVFLAEQNCSVHLNDEDVRGVWLR